jgi:ABC-2 type transport system permease protein
MLQALRVIRIGWLLQLKTMARSGFDVLTAVITPITYASIAFFLYRRGGGAQTLLWVSLGAAFMGLWASTLWGAGNTIQRQRSQQTLEFAIAAPTPFLVSLIGTSLASSSVGLYSLVGTLVWGRLVFGVPLELEHPVLFALSLPAAVLSLGLLGIVMAATLILYRYAYALANMLEYPIWLAAGLLAPIALLPTWVHPISYALAPTWGVRAVRESVLGGSPLFAIGMCLALAAVYLFLGFFFVQNFERLARRRATLALS